MRQLARAAASVALLCGCGMVDPVIAPVSERPVGERPPPALINGVPGKPVSWCWRSACVDGFVNSPAILPEAKPPFEVEVIEGAVIEGASAIGPPGPNGITDRERTEIALDGTTLGAMPEDAEMLSIFVRFANGGDASYMWAVGQSD